MDFSSLIKTVAPWIGTALGGPLGGMAVEALGGALGLETKTIENVQRALSGATPEQMLAIKAADNDFALQMQKLGFEHQDKIAELDNNDRDSARKREMEVKDHTPMILAGVVTTGFFSVIVIMMYHVVPNESRDIMNMLLGVLGTAWSGVVAYYFGSSKSSERKTELMAKQSQDGK